MLTDLMQKQIAVVGLGISGIATARYLLHQGTTPLLMDSRPQPAALEQAADLADCPRVLGEFDANKLQQMDLIIVSPGIALATPALQQAADAGVEIIGDVELFARVLNAQPVTPPIVAITGSNGKTTVTTLLGEMAHQAGVKVAVGGNIGIPALALLEQDAELYVLELSSFQLETTHSLKARAAVLLNISDDHMDRYSGIAEYAAAKHAIYRGAACAIYNRQDMATLPQGVGRICSFGLDQPQTGSWGVIRDSGDVEWLAKGKEKLLAVAEIAMAGRHNIANALAALALGERAGLPIDSMLKTLRIFKGLPHRCETVGFRAGVRFVNDSKATNVGATLAAIEGLAGGCERLWLIAGGDGKGADFTPLGPLLAQHVAGVFLIGRDAPLLKAVAPTASCHSSLQDAVNAAYRQAAAGDLILLSPACASLDMFNNFEQRGEAFRQAMAEVQDD